MDRDWWLSIAFRHLATLAAVADERSFARAAERLGYTQSAVSQQIATLERLVGERLVERPGGPKAVSLTDSGELLLRHGEALLGRLHAARADLSALRWGTAGPLRLGTLPSVSARILPALMRRFARSWPEVEIQVSEASDDEELLSGIERGELDLTFAVLPLPDGPFGAVELLRDPYVLLVQAGGPLAARDGPIAPEEIVKLALVGFRRVRSSIGAERHLRATGDEPRIVVRSDDNSALQGLVAAGVGAALVPRLSVDPRADLVALPIAPNLPPRRIALAWHGERRHPTAAQAFVQAARTVCVDVERHGGAARGLHEGPVR